MNLNAKNAAIHSNICVSKAAIRTVQPALHAGTPKQNHCSQRSPPQGPVPRKEAAHLQIPVQALEDTPELNVRPRFTVDDSKRYMT